MAAANIRLITLVSTFALLIASHGTARLCAEDHPAGEAQTADVYDERLITEQFNAANDQFSVLRLKYLLSF